MTVFYTYFEVEYLDYKIFKLANTGKQYLPVYKNNVFPHLARSLMRLYRLVTQGLLIYCTVTTKLSSDTFQSYATYCHFCAKVMQRI